MIEFSKHHTIKARKRFYHYQVNLQIAPLECEVEQ